MADEFTRNMAAKIDAREAADAAAANAAQRSAPPLLLRKQTDKAERAHTRHVRWMPEGIGHEKDWQAQSSEAA